MNYLKIMNEEIASLYEKYYNLKSVGLRFFMFMDNGKTRYVYNEIY